MENAAEQVAETSMTEDQSLPIANIASRAIAALVDFLVISAFVSLATKLVSLPGDPTPYFSFAAGALYFGFSHSKLLQGKTLGKRLFGLSVISTKRLGTQSSYLTFPEALLRYLFTYGIIILAAELPFSLYRVYSVSGDSWLLELNMLFVMSYSVANIFALLFHHNHQGLHDRLSSTVVCRGEIDFGNSFIENEPKDELRARRIMPLVGVLLGALLWLPGIVQRSEVASVQAKRFQIEGELGIRTLALQYQGNDFLLVYAILEPIDADSSEQILREIAERIDSLAFEESVKLTLPTRNYRFQYFDQDWNPLETTLSVPISEDSASADTAIMR